MTDDMLGQWRIVLGRSTVAYNASGHDDAVAYVSGVASLGQFFGGKPPRFSYQGPKRPCNNRIGSLLFINIPFGPPNPPRCLPHPLIQSMMLHIRRILVSHISLKRKPKLTTVLKPRKRTLTF